MTHWYSRTHYEFLDRKNPALLGQSDEAYAQRNGYCWDPRVRGNWTWTLDETAMKLYNDFMETPLARFRPDCDASLLTELLKKAAKDVDKIRLAL